MELARTVFGDLSGKEFQKFSLLGGMFLFLIGPYWSLRVLKDAQLRDLIGVDHLPQARIVSFVVMIPLVLFYTKLVDLFKKKEYLMYCIVSFYSVAFTAISLLWSYANQIQTEGVLYENDEWPFYLAFVQFVTVESFGSLSVTLFWSLANAMVSHTTAKKGYGLIIFLGQMGSILGPFINIFFADRVILIYVLCSCSVATVGVLTYIFSIIYNKEDVQHSTHDPKKSTPGLFVGLKLLLTQPYLLGIFGVSTLYEVVGTIIDFQMKTIGSEVYNNQEEYRRFLGWFGVATNVVSMGISLLGTSALLRKLGVRFAILLYPLTVLTLLIWIFLQPSITTITIGLVVLKGLSYAVNNPAKEILYFPTSVDVKFKVKSWIDMFGGRSAKALGAVLTNPMGNDVAVLLNNGTILSMVITVFWVCVAFYTGSVFARSTGESGILASTSTTIEEFKPKEKEIELSNITVDLNQESAAKDNNQK